MRRSRFELARAIGIVLIGLVITTSSIRATEFSDFCNSWSNYLFDPDDIWCTQETHPYHYSGGYDLEGTVASNPDGYLDVAAALCDDAMFSCWDDCDGTPFKDWALARINEEAYPYCEYHISCVEPYTSTNTCTMGPTGSFACRCGYINVCAPC